MSEFYPEEFYADEVWSDWEGWDEEEERA